LQLLAKAATVEAGELVKEALGGKASGGQGFCYDPAERSAWSADVEGLSGNIFLDTIEPQY